MRIDTLTIKNFRCFEARDFVFNPSINIFVGNNATGKTAVLDALAFALRSYVDEMSRIEESFLRPTDVRRIMIAEGAVVHFEAQMPVVVKCTGELFESKTDWARVIGTTTELWMTQIVSDDRRFRSVASAATDEITKGVDRTMPVVSYWGSGRRPPNLGVSEMFTPGSRLSGYDSCLDTTVEPSVFARWMKTQELQALQEGAPSSVFLAVKAAIASGIQGCREVFFNIRQGELLVTMEDREKLPFSMLSDGQRGMMAMVADIAYRMAVLNPQLGPNCVTQTPGVVLVDEIDFHLHPKWQRRVLDDLRRAFPLVQFFATSHSPFIIQSLKPDELISLDHGSTGEYYQRSIEDIVESVMGVDHVQRSELYWKMFNAAREYHKLLRSETTTDATQREKLKNQLDALTAPFGHDPAYQAFLAMEREAADLGEGASGEKVS